MFGKTATVQSKGFGNRIVQPQAEGLHAERRASRRLRIHKPAQLILNEHNSAIDILVRDISDGGVRVRIEDYVYLPDRFELRFRDHAAPCHVVMAWRQGLEMGLSFVQ
jgi:hypothetical protein